ncbi:MAG: bifunctional hydroxymethylpyrimidine kinase/phosphomethylpyrimidine kinase, partial [Verrucomicrobiota bacterium]
MHRAEHFRRCFRMIGLCCTLRRVSNHLPKPVALTIAGSDSGGGAGIQADLRTFIELGVHGTTAITAITAQNPAGVRAVLGTRPEIVHSQIEAVATFYPIGAAKTGMLYDIPIIEVVIEFFAAAGRPAARIVDPVMVATSGSKLLLDPAIERLRSGLLPLATLVTPNLDEAELLLNRPVRTADAM